MKKLIFLFILTVLPCMAWADDSGSCGDNVTYYFEEETGTLTISGTGAMNNYSDSYYVPWYSYRNEIKTVIINGNVTSIGENAFSGCNGLTSINIPNSVISIGRRAFDSCRGLTSVTIPNSVTSIGDDAFYCCSGLTSVIIPNSVTSIGWDAFAGCSGLTSVTIPNSITSIDGGVFAGCSSLTSVIIPNNVTSIGSQAFGACSGLLSVTIPNSVTSIDNEAFASCTGLTSVTIPQNVTSIGRGAFAYCNGITEVNYYATNCTSMGTGNSPVFNNCPSLITLNIGDNVQNIPAYAFSKCTGLVSVTIPNNITSIGNNAFRGCSGLTKVNYNATNCKTTGSSSYPVFSNCSSLNTIIIGDNVQNIPAYAFAYCNGLASVTIPNSVTSIDPRAFMNCKGITTFTVESENTIYDSRDNCNAIIETSTNKLIVGCKYTVIPNDVTSIGGWAFTGCSDLTSFVIRNILNNVTSIGENAFRGCTGLTFLDIPNSVKSIDEGAFSYCTSLTEVNYNAINCTSMTSVFSNCTSLKTLNIGENVQNIPAGAFSKCTGFTSITIPNSVTSIGDHAFSGCTGLKEVNYNATNCTSMGVSVPFNDCSSFTTLNIGNNVQNIPAYTFASCTGLTSVTIPNSVTSIGDDAFESCSGLTSVTIPNSVKSIGTNPFSRCSGLTSISVESGNTVYDSRENCNAIIETSTNKLIAGCKNTILPNSVTSIAKYAFNMCKGLTSVTIPNSVTSIGYWAFGSCSGLTSVTIGNSVTSIDDYAFIYCSGLTSVTIPNSVTNIGEEAFYSCSSLTSVTIGNSVKNIRSRSFARCTGLTDLYCLVTDLTKLKTADFYDWTPIGNVTLHVPQGCKDMYAAKEPWKDFKEIVEIEDGPVTIPDVVLTAEEKDGMVTLRFNTVPNNIGYRITRVDENGAKVQYCDNKPNGYPATVEYVDVTPAAGTYTYSVLMRYTDADGEKKNKQSNEVTVVVSAPAEEETTAEQYGYIMGHIDYDKNPPIAGPIVEFSDGVYATVHGSIFTRQRIPEGTELTMTAKGEPTHNYETATITVKAGENKVNIPATWREDYEPNAEEYDLAFAFEFTCEEGDDGKYHAKFIVRNLGEYSWRGYINLTARPVVRSTLNEMITRPVYQGKAYFDEIVSYKTERFKEVDIVIEGLEPLKKDKEYVFNFTSYGHWIREGVMESAKEKPMKTFITGMDNPPALPYKGIVKAGRQYYTDWNGAAKEEFAYLMLGVSSLTPGMDGMVGDLQPYKEKLLSISKDGFKDFLEWLVGKPALEAINDLNCFTITSAIRDVYKDQKNLLTSVRTQKFLTDIIDKSKKKVDADKVLEGITLVYNAVTSEVGTYYGAFQASLACSSMLYQLAAAGNHIPLTSMMYTYQVAGETLINKARSYGDIMNGWYIAARLLENRPYRGPFTGDNKDRVNTTTEFKLIVKKSKLWGTWQPAIDFTDDDALEQIDDISINISSSINDRHAVAFYFEKVPREDCIMLRSTGEYQYGSEIYNLENNTLDYLNSPEFERKIKVMYMEIKWRNGRTTRIPLIENGDGVEINKNNTPIAADHFEGLKPLDYTITLITTSGEDDIAGELYLGSK